MNYMPEVAKVLGVELGEVFEIDGFNEAYFLDNDGLYCFNGSYFKCNEKLSDLLSGYLTIKRNHWKPKEDEEYWLVNQCGNVISLNWIDNFLCITNYKIGNCYRTKEEAKANRDKWVAFYASDEVLEV